MKSKDYWKKRAEQITGRQFKKTDDYIVEQDMMYQEALYSIRQDIETFYQRFADNNQISLNEARKLLDSNELSEFHMGLKKFTRLAKDINHEQWEKELNNASYKVRISRLQALETEIINTIEELYIKQQEGTTELLGYIYDDTYHRNIYEIGKGLNLVTDFKKVDTSMIDKVLNEAWLGSNFSDRIWKDKEKLIRELRVNLTQSFIRGDPIDKTSRIIAERMGVAKNRARTLVNTESANIVSKATFSSYEGSGVVKQYQILATLDLHTSKICRSMDGKVFNLSEKEIGLNAPPFHPNCRTTTVAYFLDEIFKDNRIARDSEGNSYYVEDMTYEEWYNKYVKGNSKEEIAEKKIKNKSSDKKQFEKYKEVLGKEVPNSFDKFQDLKYNNSEEWKLLKEKYRMDLNLWDDKFVSGNYRYHKGNRVAKTKDIKEIKHNLEKHNIKVIIDKKNKLLPHFAAGGFNPNLGQVVLRRNPTYLSLRHENFHAEQFIKIGKEAYLTQTTLQREEYVYDQIIKHKNEFDNNEIYNAQYYIYTLRNGVCPPPNWEGY